MKSLGGYLNLVPPSGLRDCVAASSTKAGEPGWVAVKDPEGHSVIVDPNPWNTWEGVQLSYRFVLPYGHRLILIPPHPARGLIGLGGVQGHPRDPTS